MKPSKLVEPVNEMQEECYEASDYATAGACGVLHREGNYKGVRCVLAEHGHVMGDISSMDPLDILIALEEHSE